MPEMPALQVKVEPFRRGDGLIFGARVTIGCPTHRLGHARWYWLDREPNRLEELQPYRIGMEIGRRERRRCE